VTDHMTREQLDEIERVHSAKATRSVDSIMILRLLHEIRCLHRDLTKLSNLVRCPRCSLRAERAATGVYHSPPACSSE
jgi:hypothetical protein